MSFDRSATFESNELNCIQPGLAEIHVPLLDDIIQINFEKRDDIIRGKILIEKDLNEIAVSRSDGAPLQIEVVTVSRRVPNTRGRSASVVRSKLFSEPIKELLFEQLATPTSRMSWCARAENMGTPDLDHLRKLASLLGTFVFVAQQRS
jgi:hypothetical protein